MSEESQAPEFETAEAAIEPAPAVESTGHPVVDDVLGSLESLDATPVTEQVAIFEAAHDKLRSALADAGNEPEA